MLVEKNVDGEAIWEWESQAASSAPPILGLPTTKPAAGAGGPCSGLAGEPALARSSPMERECSDRDQPTAQADREPGLRRLDRAEITLRRSAGVAVTTDRPPEVEGLTTRPPLALVIPRFSASLSLTTPSSNSGMPRFMAPPPRFAQ